MGTNKAPAEEITDEAAAYIYKQLILRWERGLKDKDFDLPSSSRFDDFAKRISLKHKSYENDTSCHDRWEKDLADVPEPFIYLSTNKKNVRHAILRRLRNAFAHGRFKINGGWFDLTDAAGQKITMKARLTWPHIQQLLSLLGDRSQS